MTILDDKSKTESLDKNNKNLNAKNVQFKKLLNKRHSQYDGVVVSNNIEFGERDNDKNYD